MWSGRLGLAIWLFTVTVRHDIYCIIRYARCNNINVERDFAGSRSRRMRRSLSGATTRRRACNARRSCTTTIIYYTAFGYKHSARRIIYDRRRWSIFPLRSLPIGCRSSTVHAIETAAANLRRSESGVLLACVAVGWVHDRKRISIGVFIFYLITRVANTCWQLSGLG